jgi:hypothetical protein
LKTDSLFDILMVGDRYVRVVFRKPFLGGDLDL